jgi:hypothetical protein
MGVTPASPPQPTTTTRHSLSYPRTRTMRMTSPHLHRRADNACHHTSHVTCQGLILSARMTSPPFRIEVNVLMKPQLRDGRYRDAVDPDIGWPTLQRNRRRNHQQHRYTDHQARRT